MAQPDARLGMETVTIGATMGDRGGHAHQQAAIHRGARRVIDARQPAHSFALPYSAAASCTAFTGGRMPTIESMMRCNCSAW